MIAVIQRVSEASVTIDGNVKAKIEKGLLVLLGIEEADNEEDIEWLALKIANLRIFNDENGIMNVSVIDAGGNIIPIYERMISSLQTTLGKRIQTGEFGADMKISLVNDGPVTIVIDTKNRV
jgi:D-aminoacyl-tRNA deacylase